MWLRLQNAMLGIGVNPAASGGSLQLGTGSANGIGFQSGGVVDARIYRNGAAALVIQASLLISDNTANGTQIGGSNANNIALRITNNAASGRDYIIGSSGTSGPVSSGGLFFFDNTAGANRLAIKANGQVRFIPLSADPGGAETGDVYYNSTTNKLRVYNGAWVDLH
jgi:hypothetical protein